MTSDIDYEFLASRFADAGIVTSLSELHGGLCGTLCVGGIAASRRWLGECLEDWRLADDEIGSALQQLESAAWEQLTSLDLNFEPLIPDEDEPLETQVHGLALWCHGFLAGLGFGGFKSSGASGNHAAAIDEITKDFAELSRAALGDEQDVVDAGFALAELREYVRVGVQLVFEEYGANGHMVGSDLLH